ncbi:hypothetical protein PWG71_17415 [Nocardiopsis sp. N85]|uniref:hypothetical protein n=1 Tax=Nocardiopsis sp. N85 TaxID=3029400 RepID=UPI00237F4B49|nr:hypothetical protein [Nocardiopsis sp. N85]MDE3723174.1 hypothetical protein [Nocardiopsis sp. N85]
MDYSKMISMLSLMFACALTLYLFRFLATEFMAKSGAHPRRLDEFSATLTELRLKNHRENAIVFGTSAADEKYLILDNMLALINFRRHTGPSETASGLSGDADRRFSEYAGMLDRLNQEIARSVPGARTPAPDHYAIRDDSAGSVHGTDAMRVRLIRLTHIVLMVALGLLAAATAVIG